MSRKAICQNSCIVFIATWSWALGRHFDSNHVHRPLVHKNVATYRSGSGGGDDQNEEALIDGTKQQDLVKEPSLVEASQSSASENVENMRFSPLPSLAALLFMVDPSQSFSFGGDSGPPLATSASMQQPRSLSGGGRRLSMASPSQAELPPPSLPLSRRSALGLFAALPLAVSADSVSDKIGPDGRYILKDPEAATVDVLASPPKVTSQCFLDISVEGNKSTGGRVVFDLYGELMPKTAENFRQLCSGEAGFGYAGSEFFKVIDNVTLVGGVIEGHGSIYGPTFAHESYKIKHNVAGMLSMFNAGKFGELQESDSRFIIQLVDDAGYLDGRYVAFGRVSEGMDVVRRLEKVKVTRIPKKPLERVSIDAAGVLEASVVQENVAPPLD